MLNVPFTYNVSRKIIFYLNNIRISNWRAYMSISFLGLLLSMTDINHSGQYLINYLICLMLFLAFTFSINNCFDVKTDLLNDEKKKRNPIATEKISFNEGIIFSLLLALMGLITAFFWFSGKSFLTYFFLMFLGYAYSSPPFRLKSIPIIDIISHGLFFGVLLLIFGLLVNDGSPSNYIMLIISIFLSSVILELRNHLEDIESDALSGIKTTVVWLGEEKSKRIINLLIIINASICATIITSMNILATIIIMSMCLILYVKLKNYLKREYMFIDILTSLTYGSLAIVHVISLL